MSVMIDYGVIEFALAKYSMSAVKKPHTVVGITKSLLVTI
jgi:hypothetical protein